MPQYLAPGVYVEETSFRTKTIEGVGTSTAAFLGPTRTGPISGYPELLTSLSDFEAIYGSIDPITFEDRGEMVNFLAQGVRAFYDNGGSALYVMRTYRPGATAGFAQATLSGGSPPHTITWQGRYPGSGGNVTLAITITVGQNVLSPAGSGNALRGGSPFDLVWISQVTSPPGAGGQLFWAESYFNKTTGQDTFRFHSASGAVRELAALVPGTDEVRILNANVVVTYPDGVPRTDFFPGLTFDPRAAQSFSNFFGPVLSNSHQQNTNPITFSFSDTAPAAGIEIAQLMLGQIAPVDVPALIAGQVGQFTEQLTNGSDGNRPEAIDYQGAEDPSDPQKKTGLVALEDVSSVSIVAAPGSTFAGESYYKLDAMQTTFNLIAHCEKMRYRIAVLDSPDGESVIQAAQWRGQIDSTYAAFYYPWVRILDPVTDAETNMPPAGYVAGIYARSDTNVGVHKAPANEVVTDALSFEVILNKAQQDLLNPLGVNCFRFFEGRGYRLFGARTAGSDSEVKYVNVRRYLNYLKASIDLGTQSVVFENNGPDLWAKTTQLISDFLYNEFRNSRLFGTTKEQAFFVRCDLTTMTQNDLDNGRMVCLIGVSLLRPAEFVIFRIGQFTASAQQ
ncbi:MAG: phage tail sheath subtilisin-like domain-containing protein [Acidobacteriia bacterium]|nr:phage tail sheath subtilisin-like domain-containing protein [Terriglobia bacterium]